MKSDAVTDLVEALTGALLDTSPTESPEADLTHSAPASLGLLLTVLNSRTSGSSSHCYWAGLDLRGWGGRRGHSCCCRRRRWGGRGRRRGRRRLRGAWHGHLVRVVLGAVEGDGPGGESCLISPLVLYLQLPGPGRALPPAEHRQEGPVMEACPGGVVRSPGQELGLGSLRRGEEYGEVSSPGRLNRDVSLDVLQEVDISVVGDLHLGTPAAGGGDGHGPDGSLDSALNLRPDILPLHRHLDHAAGVHHSVPEGVAVVPAETVDPPVRGPEVGHLAVPDGNVLDVSPVEVRVGLQDESHHPGRHGGAGTGSGVTRSTPVVEISRDHFPLPTRPRAVGGGHGGAAGLAVPGDQTVLSGAGHGEGPDGVGVAVTVTVVVIPPSVPTRPHEDAAPSLPPICHSVDEGSAGEIAGSVHCLAIVIRAPGGAGRKRDYKLQLSD